MMFKILLMFTVLTAYGPKLRILESVKAFKTVELCREAASKQMVIAIQKGLNNPRTACIFKEKGIDT